MLRGKFVWLPARTVNAELVPRKHPVIPARGAIQLRQVLDYKKPPAPKR